MMVSAIFTACIFIGLLILIFYPFIEDCLPKPYEPMFVVIKFDTFLKFYNIAPDSWILYSDCVGKINGESIRGTWDEKFSFSAKELPKYKKWMKAEKERKEYERKMSWLAESVKKDIEKYSKDSIEERNKAIDKIAEEVAMRRMKYMDFKGVPVPPNTNFFYAGTVQEVEKNVEGTVQEH